MAQATPAQIEQAAHLLQIGFRGTGTDFAATLADARAEVAAMQQTDRIARLAIDAHEQVLG